MSPAAELRLWGEGRNISFVRLLVLAPSVIIIAMGRLSLAHADGEVMIIGMGGIFPFHPEINIKSIVDPDIEPSFDGNGCVIPRGALSSKSPGRLCFPLLLGSLVPGVSDPGSLGALRCRGTSSSCRARPPVVLPLVHHAGWLAFRSPQNTIFPPLSLSRLSSRMSSCQSAAEADGDAYTPMILMSAWRTTSICHLLRVLW